MTHKDDLFELVNALAPNEKRYFKLHAKKHLLSNKKCNYEKLFDALCKLGDYNEKEFKLKNKGKPFIKNLPAEKHQLFDLILRVMRSYHAEQSIDGILSNSLADIRFLYNKGMYSNAKKQLDKAMELAAETEQLPVQIALAQMDMRIAMFYKVDENTIAVNTVAENKILLTLMAERRISHLKKEVYNLYQSKKLKGLTSEYKTRLGEVENTLKAIIPTFTIKRDVLLTKAVIAEAENDYRNAFNYYAEMLKAWELAPIKDYEPSTYIRSILGNYLACAHYCERFDVFPEIIRKIEVLPVKNRADEVDNFYHSKKYRLILLLNTNSSENIDRLIEQIDSGINKYRTELTGTKVIILQMNICVLYLHQRMFDKLIKAVACVYETAGRNEKFVSIVRDLRFFELMALISTGNYEVAQNLIYNTNRWLLNNKLKNVFLSRMLKIFKELTLAGNYKKARGQIVEAKCPPEFQSLQEIILRWLNKK